MTGIDIRGLTIEHASAGYIVRPIDHFDLQVGSGELVLLLGASGSGKTTLLSALAAILRPTVGTIRVGEVEVTALRGAALTEYRRHRVGVVFQTFNYEAGQVVFEQGDRSDLVYAIEDGEIEIVRQRADGTEEALAMLGPGRYFGDLGPLFGLRRSATARAVKHAVLTGYSARDFRELVGSGRLAEVIGRASP